MGTREIKRYCSVNDDAEKLLETAINKLGLSARAYSRVLDVGRTIVDIAGADNIEASHIAEAIQYQSLEDVRKASKPADNANSQKHYGGRSAKESLRISIFMSSAR